MTAKASLLVLIPTIGLVRGQHLVTFSHGDVMVSWAGLQVIGRVVTHEGVLAIERAQTASEED